MSSDALLRYKELVEEGRAESPHRYDQERYDELLGLADGLTGSESTRALAKLEALAKTGWSLTRSDEDRSRFAEIIELGRAMNGGISFSDRQRNLAQAWTTILFPSPRVT